MTDKIWDGLKLRELRQEKQWTQKQLGSKAKVNSGDISSYETDKKVPGDIIVAKLASALGVSKDDFYTFLEEDAEANTSVEPAQERHLSIAPETATEIDFHSDNHVASEIEIGRLPISMDVNLVVINQFQDDSYLCRVGERYIILRVIDVL